MSDAWKFVVAGFVAFCLMNSVQKITEQQKKLREQVSQAIELLEKVPLPDNLVPGAPQEVAQEPVAEKPVPKEPEKPAAPEKQKMVVVQHTMNGCGWCDYDKRRILPTWAAIGYTIKTVDEKSGIPGKSYPYYEIYGPNGEVQSHVGSLSAFGTPPRKP